MSFKCDHAPGECPHDEVKDETVWTLARDPRISIHHIGVGREEWPGKGTTVHLQRTDGGYYEVRLIDDELQVRFAPMQECEMNAIAVLPRSSNLVTIKAVP